MPQSHTQKQDHVRKAFHPKCGVTSSLHAQPCNFANTTLLLPGFYCFPFQHLHTLCDISQHICTAKNAWFGFFPCRGWGCVWPWMECHCSKLPHRGSSLFAQVWAQDLWFGKAALEQLMQHSAIPCSHRGLWLVQASAGAAVFYTHTHNILWGRHFAKSFENPEFHSPPQRWLRRIQVLLQLPAVAGPAGIQ